MNTDEWEPVIPQVWDDLPDVKPPSQVAQVVTRAETIRFRRYAPLPSAVALCACGQPQPCRDPCGQPRGIVEYTV